MKIFIVGYPLSGKSTIGKEIAKRLKCEYLSTGAYARSLGMTLEASIKEKDFSEEFNDAIEAKVWEVLQNRDCVIDGYPRSVEQITKILSIQDKRVIYCYANPVVIADRLKQRALVDGRVEDTDEIVAGRIRASIALKKELDQYVPLETVDTGNKYELDNFWRTI